MSTIPISDLSLESLFGDSLTASLCVNVEKGIETWVATGMLVQQLESFTDSVVVRENNKPIGIVGGKDIIVPLVDNPTSSLFYDTKVEDVMETRLQRSCQMYKIRNDLAPTYLVEACPPLVGEMNNYNLRNADAIAIPMGRRTGYVNSFMPGAIRLWNGLDRNIRNCNSIESFKYNLKKAKCRKKNKLYSKFNGSKAVNQTRMRMGLSGLKAQRHDYNHVPRPTCDYCGARKEDAMHYLLQCATFTASRAVMLNEVMAIYHSKNIVLDLTRTLVKKDLVNCLLRGDVRLNYAENSRLLLSVQNYICSSKRF
jgi:hypothetical protein